MLFKDIYGQNTVKETFINAVTNNRLAHAILLHGPQGTGKLALAIAIAQYINCSHKTETDACGQCPSCKQYQKLMHPDLHFVFPFTKEKSADSTTSDYFLPQWRKRIEASPYFNLEQWEKEINQENKQSTIYSSESEEIIKKLSIKSYESEYKTMIIWLPEKMQEACANKLLKIIEEPPSKTVFLLVSEEPDKILQTITSRTQHYFVPPLTEGDIKTALSQKYTLTDEEISSISRSANGNLIKAFDVVETTAETTENFNLFVQIMRLSYLRDAKGMYEWAGTVSKLVRKRQITFLQYAQKMLRESFVYNLKNPKLNYLTPQEDNFSSRFSPFINEKNIAGFLSEFSLAERHLEQNVSSEMVFFDLALKSVMLIKK